MQQPLPLVFLIYRTLPSTVTLRLTVAGMLDGRSTLAVGHGLCPTRCDLTEPLQHQAAHLSPSAAKQRGEPPTPLGLDLVPSRQRPVAATISSAHHPALSCLYMTLIQIPKESNSARPCQRPARSLPREDSSRRDPLSRCRTNGSCCLAQPGDENPPVDFVLGIGKSFLHSV